MGVTLVKVFARQRVPSVRCVQVQHSWLWTASIKSRSRTLSHILLAELRAVLLLEHRERVEP